MQAKIVNGTVAIEIKMDEPRQSSTGKTLVVATGTQKIAGPDGKVYTVAVNVYTKP